MRRVRSVAVAALLGFSASGCAMFDGLFGKKDAPPANPPPANAPASADAPLPVNPTFSGGTQKPLVSFGMIAPTGEDLGQFSADELNAYLTDKLVGQVATKLYGDADALADAVASGTIEAAWVTPPAYVRLSAKAKLTPIARLSRHGATSYRSVIFAKADSPLATVDDLTAKTFVWIGRESASSNVYPRLLLAKTGLNPDKLFKDIVKVDDHAAVCKAVLDGKADAGATFADETTGDAKPIVDGCREAGFDPKLFKVIAETSSIPNDVIVARADLPSEVETHLRAALLEMATTDKGMVQLRDIFHADGFGAASDSDFAPVRAAVKLTEKKQ